MIQMPRKQLIYRAKEPWFITVMTYLIQLQAFSIWSLYKALLVGQNSGIRLSLVLDYFRLSFRLTFRRLCFRQQPRSLIQSHLPRINETITCQLGIRMFVRFNKLSHYFGWYSIKLFVNKFSSKVIWYQKTTAILINMHVLLRKENHTHIRFLK